MSIELTHKQKIILAATPVTIQDAIGPTKIGEKCGKEYGSASPWACPALKRLCELNLVKRHDGGKYSLTGLGFEALEESGMTSKHYDMGPGAILDAYCPRCGAICSAEEGHDPQCFKCGYGTEEKS